jgi:hypothetical protein
MAFGIAGKVVCIDRLGCLTPLCAPIEKQADQFPFLRIDTYARPSSSQEGVSLIDKVPELLVSIRMWFGMQPFDIASGADVLLVE